MYEGDSHNSVMDFNDNMEIPERGISEFLNLTKN